MMILPSYLAPKIFILRGTQKCKFEAEGNLHYLVFNAPVFPRHGFHKPVPTLWRMDTFGAFLITKACYFPGFYTYFASNGFSYGSSWKNWKLLSKFAIESGLVFVPSVGPGYIDTQVRPWNGANTRHRRRGSYYEVGWRSAMAANAPLVSITSFNEWHEGTQIEPAVPFSTPDIQYLDYQPDGPLFYLNLTRWWVHEFTKQSSSDYITPFVIPR